MSLYESARHTIQLQSKHRSLSPGKSIVKKKKNWRHNCHSTIICHSNRHLLSLHSLEVEQKLVCVCVSYIHQETRVYVCDDVEIHTSAVYDATDITREMKEYFGP